MEDLSMRGRAYAALVLLSLGIAAGKIELEIISPAPCSKRTHEKCDCLYQALINERVSFIAAVNTDQKLDMRFGFFTNLMQQPLDNCTVTDCLADPRCVRSCYTTEGITREITFEQFLVVASPYKQWFGDASKTVCVQVNETSSLAFNSYPGNSVSSWNGSLTLSYKARGYPLPVIYELVCDGLQRKNDTQGVFHLVDLPDGEYRCHATAENRVSRAVSRVTVVRVEKPSTVPPRATDYPFSGVTVAGVEKPSTVPPRAAEDRQTPFIVGTVAAAVVVVVVLLIAIPLLVRKYTSKSQKTPLSIVNIHNDRSCHTTYVHNGLTVESYGPNSKIVTGSALSPLLEGHNNNEHKQDWTASVLSGSHFAHDVEAYVVRHCTNSSGTSDLDETSFGNGSHETQK